MDLDPHERITDVIVVPLCSLLARLSVAQRMTLSTERPDFVLPCVPLQCCRSHRISFPLLPSPPTFHHHHSHREHNTVKGRWTPSAAPTESSWMPPAALCYD